MVICPKFEKCLVYLTYILVAATAIICAHQIRCYDKCWNWIYIPYFLISANALAKLFQVDCDTTADCFEESRSRSRGGTSAKKKCGSKCGRKKKEKKEQHHDQCSRQSYNHCDTFERTCLSSTRSSAQSSRSAHPENVCTMPGWLIVDDFTSFLATLLCLPCLLTQFLLCSDTDCSFAYVPLLLSAFPLMVYMIDNVRENSMLDILVIGNVIFLSAYSTKYNSPYGIAAAIIFAVIHFILKPIKCLDYTKEMFYNFALSLFVVLCLYTLSGKCFFTNFDWLEMLCGS